MSVSTVDIATRYLGLTLRSPIVAAASPVTGDVDKARRLAAEGVGALVLPSLFEEEIVAEEVGLATALEAGWSSSTRPEPTSRRCRASPRWLTGTWPT